MIAVLKNFSTYGTNCPNVAKRLHLTPPLVKRPTCTAAGVRDRLISSMPSAVIGRSPWLRIPSAITERSRAPERGLPRCYQLLVPARQSAFSRAAASSHAVAIEPEPGDQHDVSGQLPYCAICGPHLLARPGEA